MGIIELTRSLGVIRMNRAISECGNGTCRNGTSLTKQEEKEREPFGILTLNEPTLVQSISVDIYLCGR